MKKIFAIGVLLIFIFAFSAAAFAAQTEDGVITLTPADLVNGASGEGWGFSDDTLTITHGYTLIFEGDCPFGVKNYGTIKGGTFSGEVINEGHIGGGTFDNEVFNRGGGTIYGGIFTKQVTNDDTIESGKFDCNVKNNKGGAIAGGDFGEWFSVENDGDIRGGNFGGSVSNDQNAVILTGVFTGNLFNYGTIEDGAFHGFVHNRGTIENGNFTGDVENLGTIKDGNFSDYVNNDYDATISGGVFTGGLANHGTVTGTADLGNTDMRGNQDGVFGKDIILGKAEIRGDLTYTDCDPSTEVTLHYYADGFKTAEWEVSGEKYSYKVEKYRRADPEAELSTVEEITHKVEAVPMEGYEITIDHPIWDRFHVAVAAKHTHSFDTEWKSDGTNHWHECSCGAKTEVAVHSGGVTTCTERAICETCGFEHGEVDLNNHDHSGELLADGAHHYRICARTGCDEILDKEACFGGVAICTEKAVCAICGFEHGEVNPDNHGKHETVTKGTFDETCTADGYTGDIHCKGCDEILIKGTAIIAHGHDYGEWKTVYKATEDYRGKQEKTCAVCGDIMVRYTKPLSESGIDIIAVKREESESNPNTGVPVLVNPALLMAVIVLTKVRKRR